VVTTKNWDVMMCTPSLKQYTDLTLWHGKSASYTAYGASSIYTACSFFFIVYSLGREIAYRMPGQWEVGTSCYLMNVDMRWDCVEGWMTPSDWSCRVQCGVTKFSDTVNNFSLKYSIWLRITSSHLNIGLCWWESSLLVFVWIICLLL